MSCSLILLILLFVACMVFIVYVIKTEDDILRLKQEKEYWKNRVSVKHDLINEIYQLIKNHYDE